MARRRSSHHDAQAPERQSHRRTRRAADDEAAAQTNGVHGEAADRETVQRAEEIVDHLGEQIGHYATLLGHGLLRLAARAREEAEDIWAEAQDIRRRGGW